MNIGESIEYLRKTDQNLIEDVCAEPDPNLRTWYEEETTIQPDYLHGLETESQLKRLATGLSRIVAQRQEADIRPIEPAPQEIIEEAHEELPYIPSPEEILKAKIERKYKRCLADYEEDVAYSESIKKTSKKQKQLLISRRNFVKSFTSFEDITGDEHIVLVPELFSYGLDLLQDKPELLAETVNKMVEYAQYNGAKISSDPSRFAKIISRSVSGRIHSEVFDKIIVGVFAARQNKKDYTAIHANFAHAAFEIFEDKEALRKIASIALFEEKHIPRDAFILEVTKHTARSLVLKDRAAMIEIHQIDAVFTLLVNEILGLNYTKSAMATIEQSLSGSADAVRAIQAEMEVSTEDILTELSGDEEFQALRSHATGYDPVSVTGVDGAQAIELNRITPSPSVKASLLASSLFRKRMQHLAPYAYAKTAARALLGPDNLIVPLSFSPSLTVEICTSKGNGGKDVNSSFQKILTQVSVHITELASKVWPINTLGVSSYDQSGELRMIYIPIYDDPKDGVIIVRPRIALDKRLYGSNLLLMLQHSLSAEKAAVIKDPSFIESENAELRQEIPALQKRFFGRRPVKFTMPESLKSTGLNAVSIRKDANSGKFFAKMCLHNGDVELELTRDYFTIDKHVDGLLYSRGHFKPFYENIILKLARLWTCAEAIDTSDGIVSEETKRTANTGHFGYLRMEEGGKKFKFSPAQADACFEEQGKCLAEESKRLADIDPTDRGRNSTYYREKYDPHKPPLEVYFDESILT